MTTAISVVEVSPRDGLQNEKMILDTSAKIALITSLVGAGASRLEVTSFVRPGAVPQLADADELMRRLADLPLDASFIGLVLNTRGADRAVRFDRINEVNIVIPCTDSFGRANQGLTTDQAVAALRDIVPLVQGAGKLLSVTLAVAFGCPYEGAVRLGRYRAVLEAVADCGCDELAIADTLGCAVPPQVEERFAVARATTDTPLRAHFHETRRTGLANAWAAYGAGVRRFDSSAGGVGGCPFAPGAAGNVATEDLAWLFDAAGVQVGLDAEAFAEIGGRLCADLDVPTRSGIGRSGVFPPR